MHTLRLMLITALPAFFACPARQYVADDGPASKATTAFTKVPQGAELRTTDPVNLRTGPSAKEAVSDVLEAGAIVAVTTGILQDKWLEGTSAGRTGWVYAPYVTFDACLRLDEAASHLRDALAKCPGAGDGAIYGFSRASCEAASASCSTVEMDSLLGVATCDVETVPSCKSDADRPATTDAINHCAANAASISSECMSGLSP